MPLYYQVSLIRVNRRSSIIWTDCWTKKYSTKWFFLSNFFTNYHSLL